MRMKEALRFIGSKPEIDEGVIALLHQEQHGQQPHGHREGRGQERKDRPPPGCQPKLRRDWRGGDAGKGQEQGILPQGAYGAPVQPGEAAAEQGLYVGPKGGHVRIVEDGPPHHRRKEGEQPAKELGDLLPQARQILVHHKQQEPEQSPQHKVPGRPVPEARQCPDDQQIQHPSGLAPAAAPQGDVHVLPEEAAQGHVPTAPEIRGGGGEIGVEEVLLIGESQHPSQADGHVGIGGKVIIELQRIEKGAQPRPGYGSGGGPLRQGSQQEAAAGVGQQHLLPKAQQKPAHAVDEIVEGGGPLVQGRRHVGVLDDGPGDELGETAHIQQQPPKALLDAHLAPVHVHSIGQDLKGVEGDADGEPGGIERQPEMKQGRQCGEKESGVLKVHEPRQGTDDAQYEEQLFRPRPRCPVHEAGDEIVEQGGADQEQDHDRLPPGVEHKGKDHQHAVAPLETPAQKVQDEQGRQKQQQECKTRKHHDDSV